jgi:hypothetical protein
MAMMTFSVAMKGNSCAMRRAMTFGYTTSPSEMFWSVERTMSAVRNASGSVIRRFALVGVQQEVEEHKLQTTTEYVPVVQSPLEPLYG